MFDEKRIEDDSNYNIDHDHQLDEDKQNQSLNHHSDEQLNQTPTNENHQHTSDNDNRNLDNFNVKQHQDKLEQDLKSNIITTTKTNAAFEEDQQHDGIISTTTQNTITDSNINNAISIAFDDNSNDFNNQPENYNTCLKENCLRMDYEDNDDDDEMENIDSCSSATTATTVINTYCLSPNSSSMLQASNTLQLLEDSLDSHL